MNVYDVWVRRELFGTFTISAPNRDAAGEAAQKLLERTDPTLRTRFGMLKLFPTDYHKDHVDRIDPYLSNIEPVDNELDKDP